MIKILGFAGSLRKGSYNKLLLNNAYELISGKEAELEIYDLINIPLYNQDIEKISFPDSVKELHSKIKDADCLLIASPEYNYSVTGVLKNAIDWASRPADNPPILGKPAAIMGASPSGFGTVRSQLHLRQVLFALAMPVVSKPEVHVSAAGKAFDDNGDLLDERIRQSIGKLIENLIDLTLKLKK